MKHYLVAIGISLVYAILAYVVLLDWVVALAVFAVYMACFALFLVPAFRTYGRRVAIIHQAYRFVNNFMVSLSITHSGEAAYDAAKEGNNDPLFLEMDERINAMSAQEKIEYLASYFQAPFYPMFLSVYAIYSEQGGDCLSVADPLLKEITRDEEHARKMRKDSQKVLVQFGLFWLMGGIIMGFLRYGLYGYYDLMLGSMAFRLIAIFYFFLVLVSLFLFARSYTGESLWRKRSL